MKSSQLARVLERIRTGETTVSVHTSPEDAGRIFERLKPKLDVYTHVSLVGGPAGRQILAAAIIPLTRSTYAGRVEVGEDLMMFVIGERVEVRLYTAPQ